jgi:hypothetical protein
MVRNLALLAALAVALATPVATRSAGMDEMQYYVGTWTCQAGEPGKAPSHATATYTLDGGVLRQWVSVPVQTGMKTAYYLSSSTIYDAKKGMYVQTNLDNESVWSVDYAKPWTGNMEQWADHVSSTGKLSHSTTTRTNQNSFSFLGYSTLTSSKPTFKGSCTRS